MPITGPLIEARYLSRPQQFVIEAELASGKRHQRVEAHLADPGRLTELLVPERRVWLRPADDSRRRTAWTAVLIEGEDGPISLDTLLANRLIRLAFERRALDELNGYDLERTEARVGRSRFDLLATPRSGGRPLLLEVKSVSLAVGETALFPDAPTARGTRHLIELADLVERREYAAAVLFVVQRRGARRVAPHRRLDPRFAAAMAKAEEAGVRLLARRCHVELERATLQEPIPVLPGTE